MPLTVQQLREATRNVAATAEVFFTGDDGSVYQALKAARDVVEGAPCVHVHGKLMGSVVAAKTAAKDDGQFYSGCWGVGV